ncbi:MAG: alpha/beta hydrolase [Cytophagales bacterium]|nr:alpha/beta hydrolase [Cytophagales bacterium]
MEEKKTAFQFDARYYTAGDLNASTRQVWIVFHGYGHLAQYFLRKFQSLTTDHTFIIAPEGLSRFYLSELTDVGRRDNKVGATWMTRENRLMDIENYIRYLDSVFEQELGTMAKLPITLFGFSQGCATVCRWAVEGRVKFDRLILWAGLFPPDMDFEKGHEVLASRDTYMVIGDQDPFLTPERIKEFDQLADKLRIQPKKIQFSGEHEIHEETLRQFIQVP